MAPPERRGEAHVADQEPGDPATPCRSASWSRPSCQLGSGPCTPHRRDGRGPSPAQRALIGRAVRGRGRIREYGGTPAAGPAPSNPGATSIPASFPPGTGRRFPARTAQGRGGPPVQGGPAPCQRPRRTLLCPGLETHQVTFPGAASRRKKPVLIRVRSPRSRFGPQAPLLSPQMEAGAARIAVGLKMLGVCLSDLSLSLPPDKLRGKSPFNTPLLMHSALNTLTLI